MKNKFKQACRCDANDSSSGFCPACRREIRHTEGQANKHQANLYQYEREIVQLALESQPHLGSFEGQEIRWWSVGFNASHNFYLGLDVEGQLYRKSVGEHPSDDTRMEIRITKLNSLSEVGYLGHH